MGIELPNSMTSIESEAFYRCTRLASIEILDCVTSIGKNTFSRCTSLISITIKNHDCEIYDHSISNGDCYDYDIEHYKYYYIGKIFGYKDSTAQKYAEENNYKFESLEEIPAQIMPDVTTTVSEDSTETTTTNTSNISDTTTVTTELTTTTTTTTVTKGNGDSNGDGKVDVRDCSLIVAKIAKGKTNELPLSSDYNGDGVVNVRNAAAIARALANRKIK